MQHKSKFNGKMQVLFPRYKKSDGIIPWIVSLCDKHRVTILSNILSPFYFRQTLLHYSLYRINTTEFSCKKSFLEGEVS